MMSSRETGLGGFGMTPLSRDAGIFGRMITPSGWKKNLNRSPGLRCQSSRTALGMVACPLLLSVASMSKRSPTLYILEKVEIIATEFISHSHLPWVKYSLIGTVTSTAQSATANLSTAQPQMRTWAC